MPKLLMVCGPNGAGKSTLTRSLAVRDGMLVIDTDQFASEGLSPIAAGKAAANMARMCLRSGISFARESTLTAKFDFRLMEDAKARGYTVELVYICLASSILALERVAARLARGGHNVPAEDVKRRFQRSLNNLPEAMRLADSVTLLDNSNGHLVSLEQINMPM